MNIWYSSDWHLDHENLRKNLSRPFADTKEMNEAIIGNFYSHVKPGDYFYFIGDFSFNRQTAIDFFEKLPKNIHFFFIYGNHDKKIINDALLKRYCRWYGWIKDMKVGDQKITLMHYMMMSWNCSHWGAWHLHGHHHDQDQADHAIGKVLDVCVDLHDYKPLHYDEVKEFMKGRPDNWDLIKRKKSLINSNY